MQRIRETLARLTSSRSSRSSSKTAQSKNFRVPPPTGGHRKSLTLTQTDSVAPSISNSDSSLPPLEINHQVKSLSLDGLTPLGPVFLYGESNVDSDGIDLVLVHGPHGHRENSWTKDGVCWPRDLLGQDMPGARVISWGWVQEFKDHGTYNELAETSRFGDGLLEDLVRLRKNNGSDRRIVFVGHNSGGIVIKQAVATAAMSRIYGSGKEIQGLFGTIYAQTIGVVFLGVPHTAMSGSTLGETVASTTSIAPRPPPSIFLNWLKQQTELFQKIHDDFLLFTRDMQVVCIREERPTKDGLMVPKATASYQGGMNLTVDTIRTDHFDMVRFSQRTDPGYFQLLGHISKLSQGPVPSDIEGNRAQRNQEILTALYFQGISDKEGQIQVDESFEKSCFEVLSAKRPDEFASPFHTWLMSKDPLFWISGKAGSGKSTLMKYAFHDPETRQRLEEWAQGGRLSMASVYLHAGGSHLQKSQETVIRTALYQVLSERPDLIPLAFPNFVIGPWPPLVPFATLVNLTQAFWSIFSREETRTRLVVFIDGLDEYRMDERQSYYDDSSTNGSSIKEQDDNDSNDEVERCSPAKRKWLEDGHREIARLCHFTGDGGFLKFCVSSRENAVFEEAFSRAPRLRIHTQSEKAIARYCADRLTNEAPNLADANALCLEVASKSNGHILWARIAMDMLLEGSLKAIRPTLNSLPSQLGGLKGLYMHLLRNLEPSQRRDAVRIFQCMARAHQPLSLATLYFALEGYLNGAGWLRVIDDKHSHPDRDELEYICGRTKQKLKECCPQLVLCEEDALDPGQRVVFMHQTAKEFAARSDVWERLIGTGSSQIQSSLDIDLCLLSSHIRLIQCFPSIRSFVIAWPETKTRIAPEAWLLIANALSYAGKIERQLTEGDDPRRWHYLELVDELNLACKRAWKQSLQDYRPLFEDPDWTSTKCPALCEKHWAGYEPMETGKAPKRIDFLCLALQANLVTYVTAKVGEYVQGHDNDGRQTKLQRLLRLVVCPKAEGISSCSVVTSDYKDFHSDMPDPAFLDLLFRHGVSMSDPAGSKTWTKAVRDGKNYFSAPMTQHLLGTSSLTNGASKAKNSSQNRDRWVAAIKVMLAHGADPFAPIEVGGTGNTVRDDGSSSVETRPAFNVIQDTLQGEPQYALEMISIQGLVNKFSRS